MSPIEEAKKPFNTQSQSLANWLKQQKSESAPVQPKAPQNPTNKSTASSASTDGSLKISSSGHFKLAPLKRDNSASPKPTQSPLFGSPSQGVWRRIASPKKEETVLAATPEPEQQKPSERKGSMSDLPEEELVKLGIHLAQRHRQPSADGFNWAEDEDIEDWADDMPEAATEVEEPAEDLPKVATGSRPTQAWKPISTTNYVPIDQQLKEYEEKRAAQAQQTQNNSSRQSLFDDKWRGGDRYGGDRYGGDRYGNDRYGNDRYGNDRYGGDRYGGDRYGSDRYGGADRYGGDRYGNDRFDRRGRLSPERSPFGAMRYDSYDRFSNDYNPRRELYNDQSGKVEAMESGDARNYKPSGARRSPQISRAEMASPRSTHVTPASPRGSNAVAASSPASAPTAPAAASPAQSPVAAPSQPAMDAAAALLAQQEETMRQAREKAKLRKEEEQRVEEERRKAARKRAEELAKKAEARAKEKELEEQRLRPKEVPTGPSADRAKHTPTPTTNDASSSTTKSNSTTNGPTGSATSPAAIWAPKRFAGKSTTSTWSPLSYDKPRLLDDPQSPEMRNGRGTSRFFPSPKSEIGSGSPWRDTSSPTRQGQGRELPAGLSLEPNGDREIGGLAARALGDVKNLPSSNGRRVGQVGSNPNSLSGFGLAMPADVPISRIPPDTEFISKSKDNKKNKVSENGKGDKDLRKSPVGASVQPPTQPQALSAAQARQQKRSAKTARLDHKQLFYSYEMEIGREDAIERELRSSPGDLVQIAPVSVGMYTTKGSSFKPLPEVRSVIVGSYSYSISSKLKRAVREPISIIKHADMNFSLKLPA